jgi:hypothetical protein
LSGKSAVILGDLMVALFYRHAFAGGAGTNFLFKHALFSAKLCESNHKPLPLKNSLYNYTEVRNAN